MALDPPAQEKAIMNTDEKTAKAVEDYNTFLNLWLKKKEKEAAYDLLKKINLRLVKKHYKEDFKINEKNKTMFNLAATMAEGLKLKDERKKYLEEVTAKAVEDYNIFLNLLFEKKDEPAAYDLLKQIDLSLVKKHYREDFKINKEQKVIFEGASVLAETLRVEEEIDEERLKQNSPAQEGR